MQIEAVHCNALNGDGTLLLKTDVDEPERPLQYCFYLYKGSETICKTPYDQKSWMEHKVEALGKYQIKAFVRDTETGQTISKVVPYVLKEKYAQKLAQALNTGPLPDGKIDVRLQQLSPGVLWAKAGRWCDRCAWRVFREGTEKAEFERGFSKSPVLVYAALATGRYRVELTAEAFGKLLTGVSEAIDLEREELDSGQK